MSIPENMNFAPVALFVFNRIRHTQRSVEALAKNIHAADSDLFVFSDGPRSEADREGVQSVREYLKTITGFKSATIVERETNLGCALSITSGVTDIVNRYGRIIVVEDDIVTSPYFLRFMNEALDFYRDKEKVICISGYLYPVKRKLPETFFVRGADIWGWATWKRGWDLYESDGQKLLNELEARNLTHEFDFEDAFEFTQMLKSQIAGKLDTWDIQWYASAFLRDKLTLYPGKSLVRNIGYDGSGTHCGGPDIYQTKLSDVPVNVSIIPVEESSNGRSAIRRFHKYPRGGPIQEIAAKVMAKLKALIADA